MKTLYKKVRKRVFKKNKGAVDLYLPALVTLCILFLMLLFFINITADINVSNNCNMLVRKYILRMESEGGLTESCKNSIVNDVKSIAGVIDSTVVVTGTDAATTSYGDKIELKIECDFYSTNYNTYDESGTLVGTIGRKGVSHVVATEQSTAKK